MSNHVKNLLMFEGEKSKIELLMETVQSDEHTDYTYSGKGTIDFRKIIPYPECIFQGNLGLEEEERTGNRNWYDWNRAHWGVKKNACNWYKPEEGKIIFDTDYSAPLKVIEELSWLFKDVQITHSWADEEIGTNCGQVVWENGEIIGGANFNVISEKEAEDFAREVWGVAEEEEKIL